MSAFSYQLSARGLIADSRQLIALQQAPFGAFNGDEEGSGFVGKEVTPLVSCEDGNFRPVDIQFGPDGALYIVDWHNALIGHLQHNLRDPSRDHSHGRIWRVTYKDRPLVKAPKIDGAPLPALLDLLKEYEDRTRYRARRELAQRNAKEVVAATKQWIAKLDKSDEQYEHQLLEALWIFQTHNSVQIDLLKKLLNGEDHKTRAAATRALLVGSTSIQSASPQ